MTGIKPTRESTPGSANRKGRSSTNLMGGYRGNQVSCVYNSPLMARRFRFEFDPENRILLMRFEDKRLTDESLAEVYAALREYAIATNPYAAIIDFSAATQVEVSPAFIQQLALEEPAVPEASERGRIAVLANDVGFNMARMFQRLGESTRPLLHVVRTLDEALEALGVESPRFEVLP